jgi:aldehyde dehydrogenase (NAD+)
MNVNPSKIDLTEGRIEAAFYRQKDYFNTNVTKSFEWRIRQLHQLFLMLSENMDSLCEALNSDFKTALSEKVFEVAALTGLIEVTRSNLKAWMEPIELAVPRFLRESGHKAMLYREPYGVMLIMGPFNGPLISLLRPAITALAAGNTCILKVSDAPATAKLLLDLVPKYFEPCALMAFAANSEQIAEVLRLPFDFIFFTGSARVGRIVMRAAAEHLTPVLLELGGQNPALVDETANLNDAAKKIMWGATAWGGQWCTSPGYAYVHESVAEEFVTACKWAVVELYGNDPRNNPDYSRIIHARAVGRLAELIDLDKVVLGGRYDPEQRYFDPTILYPACWSDKIMQEEIFGPILPILTYSTVEEAINQIKCRPKPLAGFVFSQNSHLIEHFIANLSFGGGAVNQSSVHIFIDTMPFGGVGESGLGSSNGKQGFDSLTHAKSILMSPADIAIDHLYPPYTMDKVQALSQWLEY